METHRPQMDCRIQLAFHIVADPRVFLNDPDERQPKTPGSPSRCLIPDPERKLLAGERAELSTPRSSVLWTRALSICLSCRGCLFFVSFQDVENEPLAILGVKYRKYMCSMKRDSRRNTQTSELRTSTF